jgi:hypothetical protein
MMHTRIVTPVDSCAPAHLKLVRFPAHSPLPIAALPSMSLVPIRSIRPKNEPVSGPLLRYEV